MSKPLQQSTGMDQARAIALDLLKQLITLSSGILALSATFVPNIGKLGWVSLCLLVAAWSAMLVSLAFGIQSISAMVQSAIEQDAKWTTGTARTLGQVCKWAFVFGLVLFSTFALAVMLTGTLTLSAPSATVAPIPSPT